MEWFKVRNNIANDPKLKRYFTKAERWDFLTLMGLASDSRERGVVLMPADEIAYALDLSDDEWAILLAKFVERRMVFVRVDDGAVVLQNWGKHQYDKPSDTPAAVADRVRSHRAKQKETPAETNETPPYANQELETPVQESETPAMKGETPLQNNETLCNAPVTPCNTIDKTRQDKTRGEEKRSETDQTDDARVSPASADNVGPPGRSSSDLEFINQILTEHEDWWELIEAEVQHFKPRNPVAWKRGTLANWQRDGLTPKSRRGLEIIAERSAPASASDPGLDDRPSTVADDPEFHKFQAMKKARREGANGVSAAKVAVAA